MGNSTAFHILMAKSFKLDVVAYLWIGLSSWHGGLESLLWASLVGLTKLGLRPWCMTVY